MPHWAPVHARGLPLLVLVACAGPVEVRLDLPVAGHDSVLLVFDDGRTPTVRAATIEDGRIDPEMLAYQVDDPLVVTAAFYDLPLANMGLTEGVQNVRPDGRSIPTAAAIAVAEIDGEAATAFESATTLPPGAAALRIATAGACPSFTIGDRIEVLDAPLRFIVPIDGARALVVYEDGEAFAVGRLGTVQSLTVDARLISAFVQENGRLGLGGEEGAIYEGEVVGDRISLTETTGLGASSSVRHVGGSLGPEVAATKDDVYVLVSGTWTPVGELPRSPKGFAYDGAGGGVVFWSGLEVLAFDASGSRMENVEVITIASLRVLRHWPGEGVVAGTDNGQLQLRRLDGEWGSLEQPSTLQDIVDVQPYRDGFVYTRPDAAVFFSRVVGHCPDVVAPPGAPEFERGAAALDGALILGTDGGVFVMTEN